MRRKPRYWYRVDRIYLNELVATINHDGAASFYLVVLVTLPNLHGRFGHDTLLCLGTTVKFSILWTSNQRWTVPTASVRRDSQW